MDHYPPSKAAEYRDRHSDSLRARLTTLRERQTLRAALKHAGHPATALDLPCGSGRFWPVFAEAGVRELIAADNSPSMLEIAGEKRISAAIPSQILESSAFSILLPDDRVEFAACLRFYHHLSLSEDRLRLLSELKRVSSRYVVLSMWVDGNLGSVRRRRKLPPLAKPGYGPRICQRREDAEQEFSNAGLEIVRSYDIWPYLQMWRLYLLEDRGGR